MFSLIYLPVTHPRWSVWIISDKAILILSASVFEIILKSVFNKDKDKDLDQDFYRSSSLTKL